jgi:hypothetical protein
MFRVVKSAEIDKWAVGFVKGGDLIVGLFLFVFFGRF